MVYFYYFTLKEETILILVVLLVCPWCHIFLREIKPLIKQLSMVWVIWAFVFRHDIRCNKGYPSAAKMKDVLSMKWIEWRRSTLDLEHFATSNGRFYANGELGRGPLQRTMEFESNSRDKTADNFCRLGYGPVMQSLERCVMLRLN